MPRKKAVASPRTGFTKTRPDRDPEPVVEIHDSDGKVKTEKEPVTFFSRYREDQIVMEQSRQEQVGPKKWVTVPAVIIHFRDRMYVTNDADRIKFLRKHAGYGRQILEFGVHDERIKEFDDSGRIERLERLGRLGRMVEGLMRKGVQVA